MSDHVSPQEAPPGRQRYLPPAVRWRLDVAAPKALHPRVMRQEYRIKTSVHRRAKSPPHVLQGLAQWLSFTKIKKKLPFDSKLLNKNLYLYKLLI